MQAHVEAIEALLAPLGWPVYDSYVVGDLPGLPYLVLSLSDGTPAAEAPLAGGNKAFDDLLQLRAVAGTAEGVRIVRKAVRDVLAPGGESVVLDVLGRVAELSLYDSRDVMPDRDETITSTGRHPMYGVDVYHLQSAPV